MTHRACRDAECNICRGDTHTIGQNPDEIEKCGTRMMTDPAGVTLAHIETLAADVNERMERVHPDFETTRWMFRGYLMALEDIHAYLSDMIELDRLFPQNPQSERVVTDSPMS